MSQCNAAIFDEYDLLLNKMRWHFIFKSQRCKLKLSVCTPRIAYRPTTHAHTKWMRSPIIYKLSSPQSHHIHSLLWGTGLPLPHFVCMYNLEYLQFFPHFIILYPSFYTHIVIAHVVYSFYIVLFPSYYRHCTILCRSVFPKNASGASARDRETKKATN